MILALGKIMVVAVVALLSEIICRVVGMKFIGRLVVIVGVMAIINIIVPGISPAVREYQEIKGTAENFYKSKKDFENKYNNIINFGAPTEKTKEKVRKRVKIGPYWQNP